MSKEDHAALLQCLEEVAEEASLSLGGSSGSASGTGSGSDSGDDSSDGSSGTGSGSGSGEDEGSDSGADDDEFAQTSISLPSSVDLHPCEEFQVCDHEDPCAEADDIEECHEGDEFAAWFADLETCLNNKTEEQWAEELHCSESHAPRQLDHSPNGSV